jgi:hypothetical protein
MVESAAKQADREGDGLAVESGRSCPACSNAASEIERALVSLRKGRILATAKALEELLRRFGRVVPTGVRSASKPDSRRGSADKEPG